MTNVLVAGCSHSAHSGFSEEDYKKFHYTVLLNDNFNITNISLPGMSNFEIFKRTVLELSNNSYDFVLVQWAYMHRTWMYSGDNNVDKPTRISLYSDDPDIRKLRKNLLTNFNNDYIGIQETLMYAIAMQNNCTALNVPYLMFSGNDNFLSYVKKFNDSNQTFQDLERIPEIINLIDFGQESEEFVLEKAHSLLKWFNSINQTHYLNLGEYNINDNIIDKSDEMGHGGIETNKMIAKMLIDKIKKENLL